MGAAQRPPTAGIISRPERVSGDPTFDKLLRLRLLVLRVPLDLRLHAPTPCMLRVRQNDGPLLVVRVVRAAAT